MQKFIRFYHSLSTRLQLTTLLTSLVGVSFSLAAYITIRNTAPSLSSDFFNHLLLQMIIALIAQIIAYMMIRSLVIRPLVTLLEIMRQLEKDKYDFDVPYVDMCNQMGSLARKVKSFKELVIHTRDTKQAQEALALKTQQDRMLMMQNIRENFDETVSKLVREFAETTHSMQANAQNLNGIASDNTLKISALTNDSHDIVKNMQEVSGSATQLSVAIQDISQRTERASSLTQQAMDRSQQANAVMQALLADTSKITDVLSMISTITEQINLLALNATIEAARAGEQGKGFAVVASEVKNLAAQTAKATEDIASFVTQINAQTNNAVKTIVAVNNAITEINAASKEVVHSVASQETATKQIALNIKTAATLVDSSATIIDELSTATQHVSHSSQEMFFSLSNLHKKTGVMDNEIHKFLETLQAT